jgi:pleiotropic regulator 1
MDATIRLWDMASGKTMTVLTHHKRSVRALTAHPNEYTFASAGADHIKRWKLPEGTFMHNYQIRAEDQATSSSATSSGGDMAISSNIVNCLAVNADGVLVSGGNDGALTLCDWSGGRSFQRIRAPVQPGSLECEASIYAAAFDQSGLRLITGEGDKTIKMWRERMLDEAEE